MVTRRSIGTVVGLALLVLMVTTGYSWTANKASFSFSGPVALPGVTLGAGRYVFERPSDDVTVVRVMSSDEKQVYLLAFTRLVDRPANLPMTAQIVLGESARGAAPPIKAWYPEGRAQGHQFIYDAH